MWMKKECAVERAQRFCAGRQKRIRHGLTAGRETDTLTASDRLSVRYECEALGRWYVQGLFPFSPDRIDKVAFLVDRRLLPGRR